MIENEFIDNMNNEMNAHNDIQNDIQNEIPPEEPFEVKVDRIIQCGFTREQAVFALNNTNGNVDNAVSFLVDNATY